MKESWLSEHSPRAPLTKCAQPRQAWKMWGQEQCQHATWPASPQEPSQPKLHPTGWNVPRGQIPRLFPVPLATSIPP